MPIFSDKNHLTMAYDMTTASTVQIELKSVRRLWANRSPAEWNEMDVILLNSCLNFFYFFF